MRFILAIVIGVLVSPVFGQEKRATELDEIKQAVSKYLAPYVQKGQMPAALENKLSQFELVVSQFEKVASPIECLLDMGMLLEEQTERMFSSYNPISFANGDDRVYKFPLWEIEYYNRFWDAKTILDRYKIRWQRFFTPHPPSKPRDDPRKPVVAFLPC